jgi:hypothetical protein
MKNEPALFEKPRKLIFTAESSKCLAGFYLIVNKSRVSIRVSGFSSRGSETLLFRSTEADRSTESAKAFPPLIFSVLSMKDFGISIFLWESSFSKRNESSASSSAMKTDSSLSRGIIGANRTIALLEFRLSALHLPRDR